MCYINMENINEQTDNALVAAFQKGSDEAFEELVYRYKNPLFQYICGMVKDEAVAEDLFQDVFISFFKQRERFEVNGSFKAWLFLTARNRVFNFYRDHKQVVSLDQTDEEGNAFMQETLADNSRPLLDELGWQDFQENVRQAIEQLSPRQRDLIYLRQFLSFQEIADTLGKPLGTILADCHRAIKKLQVILAAKTAEEKRV